MLDPLKRRQFLKLSTATGFSGFLAPIAGRAEESISSLYLRLVPARKDLASDWALSLVKRGVARDAGILRQTSGL